MFEDPNKKNKEYNNCDNNAIKYNPAISFIEEDLAKHKKDPFASSNTNFKSEHISKEMGKTRVNMHNNDFIEENNNQNEFRNVQNN